MEKVTRLILYHLIENAIVGHYYLDVSDARVTFDGIIGIEVRNVPDIFIDRNTNLTASNSNTLKYFIQYLNNPSQSIRETTEVFENTCTTVEIIKNFIHPAQVISVDKDAKNIIECITIGTNENFYLISRDSDQADKHILSHFVVDVDELNVTKLDDTQFIFSDKILGVTIDKDGKTIYFTNKNIIFVDDMKSINIEKDLWERTRHVVRGRGRVSIKIIDLCVDNNNDIIVLVSRENFAFIVKLTSDGEFVSVRQLSFVISPPNRGKGRFREYSHFIQVNSHNDYVVRGEDGIYIIFSNLDDIILLIQGQYTGLAIDNCDNIITSIAGLIQLHSQDEIILREIPSTQSYNRSFPFNGPYILSDGHILFFNDFQLRNSIEFIVI